MPSVGVEIFLVPEEVALMTSVGVSIGCPEEVALMTSVGVSIVGPSTVVLVPSVAARVGEVNERHPLFDVITIVLLICSSLVAQADLSQSSNILRLSDPFSDGISMFSQADFSN